MGSPALIDNPNRPRVTRLSRWHPYPAMVPDELAVDIANEYVSPNSRVLDPFCGTGRLLMAAAEIGAQCVGYDVNPLAVLITEAKSATACMDRIQKLRRDAAVARYQGLLASPINLRSGVRVSWFSESVALELAQIVDWLNEQNLNRDEKLIAAVALSGATRDAAWIRKSGWKLHRQSAEVRASQDISAWDRFIARLDHYIKNSGRIELSGTVKMEMGEFTDTLETSKSDHDHMFDHVLTSPPYGDSNTTVQYGAASGICLDVVTRMSGLEKFFVAGSRIDGDCLGGRKADNGINVTNPGAYWSGSLEGPHARRVLKFLSDFGRSCDAISKALRLDGTATLVVGRRTVGGFRVKLDEFAIDRLTESGMSLIGISKRRLRNKRLPSRVNRFASSHSLEQRQKGSTKTMDEEIVLSMRQGARPQ